MTLKPTAWSLFSLAMASLLPPMFVACTHHDTDGRHDSGITNPAIFPAQSSLSATSSASAVAPPLASAATPALEPTGRATLIIQRVDIQGVGGGQMDIPKHYQGSDVLIETLADSAPNTKPVRDYVFCPRVAPDGGKASSKLDVYEMCKSYPACKILGADASDAGAADDARADRGVELQCGADHITLQHVDGHTVLRAPGVEREIAPFPLKITPVKKISRKAYVDL